MEKETALNLLSELQAKYVGDNWQKRRGVKIAKKTVLEEPVRIDGYVIPTGTEAVFYPPPLGKKPYSAVIFYETAVQTTIKSDGTISSREVGGGKSQPRTKYF